MTRREKSRKHKWFGCGLALLFSFASLGDAIFPPHSPVVLLAGLPGDVESENSYAEQLRMWLELAQASGQVQNLIVLSDNPEGLGAQEIDLLRAPTHQPQAARNLILKADRTNVISLGTTLTG